MRTALHRRQFEEAPQPRRCEHPGCVAEGAFKAPKSPRELESYYWFCLEHVRAYNAAWNYFRDMGADEISQFQATVCTWHRPTWKVGPGGPRIEDFDDPLGVLAAGGFRAKREPRPKAGDLAALSPAESRALAELDLDGRVSLAELKRRHRELAKRLHPDRQGGDAESEEKLKRVNQAYSFLLTCGYT
ncbi:MAG: J domain-containing protein [Alphaproteobacteria bacterium]|nr:J domain-containing protein [Alphaproteobacteria bacterium]